MEFLELIEERYSVRAYKSIPLVSSFLSLGPSRSTQFLALDLARRDWGLGSWVGALGIRSEKHK